LKLKNFKISLRNLLKWRLKIKADLEKSDENKTEKPKVVEKKKTDTANDAEDEEEDEEEKLDNEIKDALYEEKKLDKK
jgi:hypothetical protein